MMKSIVGVAVAVGAAVMACVPPAQAMDARAAAERLRAEQARLLEAPEAVGGLRTDLKLRRGMAGPAVAALRGRLAELHPELAGGLSGDSFGEALERAVAAFQRLYGLDADGVAGPATLDTLNRPAGRQAARLGLNAARLEELARRVGDAPRRVVNVPAFSLAAWEDGRRVLESRTIVGRTDAQTPTLVSRFLSLKFNPDWSPAPTNHKKYLASLASLARGDLKDIESHGLRVVDRGGAEIPLEAADAASFREFGWRFWQPPGDGNALGVVKFEIADPDGLDIYLHDTNERHKFARERRAFSSGCVRVERYEELAAWLMGRDVEAVRARVAAGRTAWERVAPVPVALVYLTAVPGEDGRIVWHPDVYGRDQAELASGSF